MSGYTGWVNEILDQYKDTFIGVQNIIKSKAQLNENQKALVDLNQDLLRLSHSSVKFKLPTNALLFDVDPSQSVYETIAAFIGDDLNLPFKEIALEFMVEFTNNTQSPFVVFAEQVDSEIQVLVFQRNSKNLWASIRGLKISINRYDYTTHVDAIGENSHEKEVLLNNTNTQTITHIAVTSIIQLLCALACSNVHITDDTIKPSVVKQTLRRSKGKLPLYSYKVLSVQMSKNSGESFKLDANQAEDEEFCPGGKRAHLRRGHPRKYKSGLKIWINSFSVGNKKLGVVDKTYNIKK